MRTAKNPFENFFLNPVYRQFKNHLYNYRLRRRIIRKILQQQAVRGPILEIGSGISTMAEGLGDILFSDLSLEAMRFLCHKKIAKKTAVMSITDLALRSDSIEGIVCSEVLEHILDDTRALEEMRRVLKQGAMLILTVPVHPKYFGPDDRFVRHERRYAIWPFLRKLRRQGFEGVQMLKLTGFLDRAALLLLAWIYPLTAKQKGPGPFFRILLPFYIAANWIFSKIVRLEAQLMPLSTTSGILIRARKK